MELILLRFLLTPYSNDVIGLQDLYLQLDPFNTVVNMVTDRIESGSDVSGTNYIVSSSVITSLVRRTPVISSGTVSSSDDTTSGATQITNRVSSPKYWNPSVNPGTTSSTSTSTSSSSSTSSYNY